MLRACPSGAIPLARLLDPSDKAAHGALVSGLMSGCSAVLIRLPAESARVMRKMDEAAHLYFENRAHKEWDSVDVQLPAVGPMPVRVGWRRPSAAKECIRWFSNGDRRRAAPPVCGSLDHLSRAAQRSLRHVLESCLRLVLGALSARPVSDAAVRRLLSDLPPDMTQPHADRTPRSNAALDVFYYHNSAQAASVPNCEPHIDRGFLSAVVVAHVECLVLHDRQTGEWCSVRRLWPDAVACADVVVFCNAELQQCAASARWPCDPGLWPAGAELLACTHAVAKAERPRVSLSYEVRACFGAREPAAWLTEWLAREGERRSERPRKRRRSAE